MHRPLTTHSSRSLYPKSFCRDSLAAAARARGFASPVPIRVAAGTCDCEKHHINQHMVSATPQPPSQTNLMGRDIRTKEHGAQTSGHAGRVKCQRLRGGALKPLTRYTRRARRGFSEVSSACPPMNLRHAAYQPPPHHHHRFFCSSLSAHTHSYALRSGPGFNPHFTVRRMNLPFCPPPTAKPRTHPMHQNTAQR